MSRDELTPREIFSNAYVTEIPPELEGIEEATQRDGVGPIQLGRMEGALLSLMVKLRAPQVVVEIGGLYGASASWILAGLEAGGRLITLEKDPKRAKILEGHLKKHVDEGRLQIVVGDARSELEALPGDLPVEMVFIDANKSGYADYLGWAEERLPSGGVLIADNTFLFGTMLNDSSEGVQPAMWNAMKAFNDRLKNTELWSSVLLPTTEGLSLALKK